MSQYPQEYDLITPGPIPAIAWQVLIGNLMLAILVAIGAVFDAVEESN